MYLITANFLWDSATDSAPGSDSGSLRRRWRAELFVTACNLYYRNAQHLVAAVAASHCPLPTAVQKGHDALAHHGELHAMWCIALQMHSTPTAVCILLPCRRHCRHRRCCLPTLPAACRRRPLPRATATTCCSTSTSATSLRSVGPFGSSIWRAHTKWRVRRKPCVAVGQRLRETIPNGS